VSLCDDDDDGDDHVFDEHVCTRDVVSACVCVCVCARARVGYDDAHVYA